VRDRENESEEERQRGREREKARARKSGSGGGERWHGMMVGRDAMLHREAKALIIVLTLLCVFVNCIHVYV